MKTGFNSLVLPFCYSELDSSETCSTSTFFFTIFYFEMLSYLALTIFYYFCASSATTTTFYSNFTTISCTINSLLSCFSSYCLILLIAANLYRRLAVCFSSITVWVFFSLYFSLDLERDFGYSCLCTTLFLIYLFPIYIYITKLSISWTIHFIMNKINPSCSIILIPTITKCCLDFIINCS